MADRSLRDLVAASAGASASRLVARAELLGLPRNRGRALEFGCGLGMTTAALADCFDEAIGVDASSINVEDARIVNHGHHNLRYLVGGLDELGKLGRFDLVYVEMRPGVVRRSDATEAVGSLLDMLTIGGVLAVRLPLQSPGLSVDALLRRRVATRHVLRAIAENDARVAWRGWDEHGRPVVYARRRRPHLWVLSGSAPIPHRGGWQKRSVLP